MSTDDHKCCGCGCVGPQGPQGIQGLQGLQGLQGPSGKDGAQGEQGSQGISGKPGQDGHPGQTGPQGSMGPQGIQGIPGSSGMNGSNGSDGKDGIQGSKGDQGVQGLQGPQGIPGSQGLQGIQGVSGQDCACDTAFLSIYSQEDQTINPNGSPTMDLVNIVSSPLDFDISLASTTGEIKILKHGIYDIEWGFDGKLTPPYPFPVPAWALGISRNGIVLPGSISGSFSITPDDLVVHDSAQFMLEYFAGDIIKIVNIGLMAVNAVANTAGISMPIASVRINILKLKALS